MWSGTLQVKIYDADDERATLASLVMDPVLLGHVVPRWVPGGLFAGEYSNIVAGWCVEHHRNYNQAPGTAIRGHFETWATKADAKLAGAVEAFLAYLSSTYQPVGTAYALDRAEKLFARVALKKLAEGITNSLAANRVEDGLHLVEGWNRPKVSATQGVNVFEDREALAGVFADAAECVVPYTGALGEFYAGQLARDSFIAFLAPEKRGKTWWLMDTAMMALLGGGRVAVFCVGDMSQNQFYRRLLVRVMQTPWKPRTLEIPKTITITKENGVWVPAVSSVPREFPEGIDEAKAWERLQMISHRGKANKLKLLTAPAGTCSVSDIRSSLAGWALEGWVPDVVVVDYADILASPTGYRLGDRGVHDANWQELRGISQEYHCCLVTATQADAAGGSAYLLTRDNFSEDKRKLAHVTGMVGINQTGLEKMAGLYRLNWCVLREDEYHTSKCVYAAGNLRLSAPVIVSAWPPAEKSATNTQGGTIL